MAVTFELILVQINVLYIGCKCILAKSRNAGQILHTISMVEDTISGNEVGDDYDL